MSAIQTTPDAALPPPQALAGGTPRPESAAAAALPPRDLLADLTWRGLRRLFAGHPILPLAPERGARPEPQAVAAGEACLLATAGSAAALRWLALQRPGAVKALALHLPPDGDGAAAVEVAARLAAGGTRAVLLHEGPLPAATPAEGVTALRIPNLGLLAGTPPAPGRIAAPQETAATGTRPPRRRVLVAVHDPVAATPRPHPRDIAYRDFQRWEVARWLDRLAPRLELVWVPLRAGLRRDDNAANLEVAMRMRYYRTVRLEHVPPDSTDALQALVHGAQMVVTTQPLLAGFALGCRVLPLLIPADAAAAAALLGPDEEDAAAAALAPLAFEPFALSAEGAAGRAAAALSDAGLRRAAIGARDGILRSLPAVRAGIAAALEG